MRKMSVEAIRAREAAVTDKRIRGMTYSSIGKELGLSKSMIRKICQRVNNRTLEQIRSQVEGQKIEQTDQLDHLQAELMDAWEASKSPRKKLVKRKAEDAEGDAGSVIVTQEIEDSYGDLSIIDRVLAVLDRKRKLWGLDAPLKVASTTADGKDPPDGGLDAQAPELRRIQMMMQTWRPPHLGRMSMDELVPPEKVDANAAAEPPLPGAASDDNADRGEGADGASAGGTAGSA